MSSFKKTIITLFLMGFINLFAGEKVVIGQPAPNFELLSSSGKIYSLNQYKGKIIVLEWINFGCPFVKKHYNSKNMQKLQKSYVAKDIVWLSICSSASGKQGHMKASKINDKLDNIGYNGSAYLIDETGDIGRMYQAKTTPHMFVIDKAGILVYDGAIDSKATSRIRDIEMAVNYVAKLLDSLLDKKILNL